MSRETGSSEFEKAASIFGPHIEARMREILLFEADPVLSDLLLYQAETGGKRLRPLLACISCLACGGKEEDVLDAASALEILHAYSLIEDDIIDHSPQRRGYPTLWKEFGTSIASCAGLAYAAALLQAGAKSKKPRETALLLGRALKQVAAGEVRDILLEQAGREDEGYVVRNRISKGNVEIYSKMADQKTASLFAASCEMGAISADVSDEVRRAMALYGMSLGVIFQVTDDILDFEGGADFGKPRGQDIREHKLGNIAVLFALEELEGKKRERLRKILRMNSAQEEHIEEGIFLVWSTRAKERALEFAHTLCEKAQVQLRVLPESEYRAALAELPEKMVRRNA